MSENLSETVNDIEEINLADLWFKEAFVAYDNMIKSAEKVIENEKKRKEKENNDGPA